VRFLIDNALSPFVAAQLSAAGHEAVDVRDYGMQASSDAEVSTAPVRSVRVVVSADTDFGTLLAASRESLPSVLLFRGGTERRPERQVAPLLANLPAIAQDLEGGAVVVIEPDRIRVRALPLLP
jgi:predicted nuclease of predicted toxin-antitoxin system